MAQIYSSNNNGDDGFFERYYQIGPSDRFCGGIFHAFKRDVQTSLNQTTHSSRQDKKHSRQWLSLLHNYFLQKIIKTGLYEVMFPPVLSDQLVKWVQAFEPDIIFAQGYNLAFTKLPLLLAKRFSLPLIYYPTDDWPDNKYRADVCQSRFLSRLARHQVLSTSRRLVDKTSVPIAFNHFMRDRYLERYGKEFTVLMHGDHESRYDVSQPRRLVDENSCWIVTTGDFDQHRWPLLSDVDKACQMLNDKGFKAVTSVFPVNPPSGEMIERSSFKFVRFEPTPSHEELVSYLRAADVLFLPERFDETAELIKLSISSKAHLFMYSRRPIIVYSAPVTGVVRYAKEGGWAEVVDLRDGSELALALEKLYSQREYAAVLVARALKVAKRNHSIAEIQRTFLQMTCAAVERRGYASIQRGAN